LAATDEGNAGETKQKNQERKGLLPEHDTDSSIDDTSTDENHRNLSARQRLIFSSAGGYTLKDMRTTAPLEELPSPIAVALDRGLTVITANQRAARTFRNAFDRRNREAGLGSWQTAPILPWETWITRLWNQLLVRGKVSELLLNAAQEHALWLGIVSADSSLPPSLRSFDSLAEMAAAAWRLVAQHNAPDLLRQSWGTTETKAFQRWAREFERQCQANHYLSRAVLEIKILSVIEEKILAAPSLALAGFDEMLPAQNKLIAAISSAGGAVEILDISTEPDQRLLVEAPDEAEEIAAAARWIRNLLIQNPYTRIGVIAVSLQDRRDEIDRSFREILAPELEDIQNANQWAPYEFSVGVPLARTVMVRTALDLLSWCVSPLPIERVSALLVSPLFAMNEAEQRSRAAFDAYELRRAKLLRPEISLPWLADLLTRSQYRSRLQTLNHAITSMRRSALPSVEELRSHAAWTDFMRTWLQAAGWGRSTGEDSVEYQTRRKWESILDLLATLDFNGRQVSFPQALTELERLVRHTIFAPESHQAPVQVMGPLEAAGSTFDALWFLGAGDLSWPIKSAVNPLLAWPLQRELGLPGANPTEEEAHAQKITARLAASARQIIFSYPKETSDGTQRASPLLRSFHLQQTELASLAPTDAEPEPVALEEFSDRLPIAPLPELAASGGVEIIKLQAACAFRAFAEKRLGSSELREIELGLDARELGSVLHHILEHFWKQVGSQEVLKRMSKEDRETTLSFSIEQGLQKAVAVARIAWEHAYIDLQRKRLMKLLNQWLELEMHRAPFVVRESEETIRGVQVGPLRLNLRVDRVDVTDEGEVIIDYKTGGAKAEHWEGKRPDEPQLPLYAVVTRAAQPDTPLVDIAFAQIRAGNEMAFEGFSQKITAKKPVSKKRELSFEEQLDEWQRVVEDLAHAFHNGNAEVDPKTYPETCKHCAQRILCRLNPAAFDEDLDEETSTGSGNG
jgi:probable DNA repair protein